MDNNIKTRVDENIDFVINNIENKVYTITVEDIDFDIAYKKEDNNKNANLLLETKNNSIKPFKQAVSKIKKTAGNIKFKVQEFAEEHEIKEKAKKVGIVTLKGAAIAAAFTLFFYNLSVIIRSSSNCMNRHHGYEARTPGGDLYTEYPYGEEPPTNEERIKEYWTVIGQDLGIIKSDEEKSEVIEEPSDDISSEIGRGI